MENTMFTCVNCNEVLEITELNEEITEQQICNDCFNDLELCQGCNEYFDKVLELSEINGRYYCNECLENNYFECSECGEYHHEDEKTEVEQIRQWVNVCNDCIEYHDDIYYYCEECDTWKDVRDYEQIEVYDVGRGYHIYMCNECKDSSYEVFYCDYHERYEKNDYHFSVFNYGDICPDALESGEFFMCDDCEDVFTWEYANEINDYRYCDSCFEEHDTGHIKSYHDHKLDYINNTKIINVANDAHVLTYGFELEVERGSGACSCGDMSEQLYNIMDGFTVYESDGSLNDGFEIISNPYDMDYYEERGKHLMKCMLQELKSNNYLSHDPGTCGLHVHVGRQGLGESYGERIETVKRIGIIVEYFKEELTILSRRKPNQLNRWAKFTTEGDKKEVLTIDYIDDLNRECRGRYYALNLQNDATIEFRLFRGTLKKETFLATLELVHNICQWAKHNEITDLNKLDFYTIATWEKCEYIIDYLESKNIIPKVLA